MKADFYMMGAQFEGTGATAIKLSQINFGEDFKGPDYGEGPDEYQKIAPQVQLAFANREGNSKYYFINEAIEDDSYPSGYAPGWMDSDDNPADPDVLLGLGFWYYDPYNKVRMFQNSGQVLGDPVWEKEYNRDFRMLVSPYPRDVKLSELTFVDILDGAPEYGDGPDEYQKTATQIQIPFANREGFLKYYFISDAIENDQGGYDPGWMDSDDNPVDAKDLVIPAGRGCWFCPSKNFPKERMTVIFPK